MKINFRITGLIALLSFPLYALFCSCDNHNAPIKNDVKMPFEAIGITPRADTLKPARVVWLDSCIAPRTIAIPIQTSTLISRTRNGKDTLRLTPPVTKKSDFFTPMTTYTADQGLYSAISSIKRDKSGNLWFGTFGGGVCRYDGKSFSTYTTANGLANNTVWSIAEDKTGNMWFGTGGGGVSRYNGNSFTTYTVAQGLANNSVWSIAEDKAGNLWFGTEGGGVSRYNPKDIEAAPGTGSKMFTTYTTAQGLASNNVKSIVEDKAGNL
jgi:ligand-binding sensor domain-containing protein